MTEEKRNLHKDLEILCAITRDPGDPIEMVHDVVAPHALRRAIAAESLIQQKDAEINRLHMECEGMELKYITDMEQKDAEIFAAEKAYEGLQTNCVSCGEYEATLKKLDDMTKAYHALQREYERFQQVAKGWNDDFQELEAKWTEAKAETATIKKTIEGLKMLYKATRRTEDDTP